MHDIIEIVARYISLAAKEVMGTQHFTTISCWNNFAFVRRCLVWTMFEQKPMIPTVFFFKACKLLSHLMALAQEHAVI